MYDEVRIYAIPPKNFKDAAEFRDYLLKRLPRLRYVFYFEEHGIRCEDKIKYEKFRTFENEAKG